MGSVIKHLKGITKEDQGRFVVVTDKNMHYDPLLSVLSYFHKIQSEHSQW